MELLLLLTAFFASLTGFAGDRAGRPIQGVAVVQAAGAVQAAVQPARRIAGISVPSFLTRIALIVRPLVAAAPIPSLRLAFEQRRE